MKNTTEIREGHILTVEDRHAWCTCGYRSPNHPFRPDMASAIKRHDRIVK